MGNDERIPTDTTISLTDPLGKLPTFSFLPLSSSLLILLYLPLFSSAMRAVNTTLVSAIFATRNAGV